MNYAQHIRVVEDFPKKGIRFYDIAPLIGNAVMFGTAICEMAGPLRGNIDKVVAFDARGFVFGAALAYELEAGLVMLRKPGKLPGETSVYSYNLEYGSNSLELQSDVITNEDRLVLVDDVIATGGTACAGLELVGETGAEIIEFTSLIDLPGLGGSQRIKQLGVPVRALVSLGES